MRIFLRAVVNWQCFLINVLELALPMNIKGNLCVPVSSHHAIRVAQSFWLFMPEASFSDLEASILLGSILKQAQSHHNCTVAQAPVSASSSNNSCSCILNGSTLVVSEDTYSLCKESCHILWRWQKCQSQPLLAEKEAQIHRRKAARVAVQPSHTEWVRLPACLGSTFEWIKDKQLHQACHHQPIVLPFVLSCSCRYCPL